MSASFCAFVLLLLSQHLIWDAVGEGVVDLVQGRYLVPIFPFLFFAFGNYKLNANIRYNLVLACTVIILYSFSAYKIIDRYYIGNCIEKDIFTCDAETVNAAGLFTTSNPLVFLSGVANKTDSISHTGKSCLVLAEQNQKGFVFKFNNLNYGDLLEVSLWQKGPIGRVVIRGDGDTCTDIFSGTGLVSYYDKTGWARLHCKVLMTDECKNAQFIFYAENTTNAKIYVDDLSFCIRKFKPTDY